ncbi:unnamed protein product [Adineta steineri]|uniref:Uncharacterized protein n=1 Tax=Adineta steineri TaxID=433720 RepID=A0A813UIY2_9BILA|nr:unnamed protein product [Adineta steineri]CAF0824337.1 unnamed protein product [Adineta steineri]
MPQTKQAKDLMLNKCQDYYRNTYQSDEAIHWYIKDSFIYRLVNRAFRTENITLWYLFRFYIIDLCKQLELIHKEQNIQTSLILYCGQSRMSINEFNYLKSNIGSFILANGFFSSTTDIQIANSFLFSTINTEDYKVILFKIIVDIDKYVGYVGECEILFSISSIFQIENVDFNNELDVWQIYIKAIETIRKRCGNKENINLIFDQAYEYYYQAMKYSNNNQYNMAIIHSNISTIDLINKNYEEALEFSMNQLLWYEKYFPDCYLSIANIYMERSQLYDYNHSNHISYLEKSLNIFENNIHIQYLITYQCFSFIVNYYSNTINHS